MITDAEKQMIKKFKKLSIPVIYKLDDTDNILYVEHVDFDLCKTLLRGKKVSKEVVQNEIENYSTFLAQSSILEFDAYTKEYFKLLIEIVNMFINYNL